MNSSASAAAAGGIEKLGLGTELRELKFGSSFAKGSKGGSFHTIRYDFKPASVDTTKPAALEVGGNNQVTISVPNSDGNGMSVFKGPRKPYTKECVLIIDNETGEVTLEKLTHTMQVKKTRQERPERPPNTHPSLKPTVQPSPTVASTSSEYNKKSKPSPSLSIQSSVSPSSTSGQKVDSSAHNRHKKNDRDSTRKGDFTKSSSLLAPPGLNPSVNHLNRRPHSPLISVPAKHSPLGPSPGHNPGPGHISPSTRDNGNYSNYANTSASSNDSHSRQNHSTNRQHQQRAHDMPSLTSNEEFTTSGPEFGMPKITHSRHDAQTSSFNAKSDKVANSNPSSKPEASGSNPAAGLSEESSSSSSSSSSSEASSDSSDEDDMEVVDNIPVPGAIFRQPQQHNTVSHVAPPSSMSGSAGQNRLSTNSTQQTFQHHQSHQRSSAGSSKSMPSHLLSEDLQLSETGSDSD